MHGVAGDIASCVVARYLLMLVSDVTSADVNLSDFVYMYTTLSASFSNRELIVARHAFVSVSVRKHLTQCVLHTRLCDIITRLLDGVG